MGARYEKDEDGVSCGADELSTGEEGSLVEREAMDVLGSGEEGGLVTYSKLGRLSRLRQGTGTGVTDLVDGEAEEEGGEDTASEPEGGSEGGGGDEGSFSADDDASVADQGGCERQALHRRLECEDDGRAVGLLRKRFVEREMLSDSERSEELQPLVSVPACRIASSGGEDGTPHESLLAETEEDEKFEARRKRAKLLRKNKTLHSSRDTEESSLSLVVLPGDDTEFAPPNGRRRKRSMSGSHSRSNQTHLSSILGDKDRERSLNDYLPSAGQNSSIISPPSSHSRSSKPSLRPPPQRSKLSATATRPINTSKVGSSFQALLSAIGTRCNKL